MSSRQGIEKLAGRKLYGTLLQKRETSKKVDTEGE